MNSEELEKRFREFAKEAASFTRQTMGGGVLGERDKSTLAESNLEIAKTIFGKWCIEIFVILYDSGPIGFEKLRGDLGPISPRVLSGKLKMMESRGLVQRTLVDSRPPGARYSLTEKGLTVATLGEPVFLYLSSR
jgi:DNA-binding HxlR family transcriptional regulator